MGWSHLWRFDYDDDYDDDGLASFDNTDMAMNMCSWSIIGWGIEVPLRTSSCGLKT